MNYSKIIQEMLLISVFAASLAFLYNFVQPKEKQLALIRQAPLVISDSLLDAGLSTSNSNNISSNSSLDNTNNKAANPENTTNTNQVNNSIDNKNKNSSKIDSIKNIKDSKNVVNSSKVENSTKSTPNPQASEVLTKTVTFEQIKSRLNNPNFLIIDARSPEDFAKGHIGEAINIFPHEDQSTYLDKIFKLNRDKTFIVYCTGGTCDLSHELAKDMLNFGHQRVFIYTGGWDEWVKLNK